MLSTTIFKQLLLCRQQRNSDIRKDTWRWRAYILTMTHMINWWTAVASTPASHRCGTVSLWCWFVGAASVAEPILLLLCNDMKWCCRRDCNSSFQVSLHCLPVGSIHYIAIYARHCPINWQPPMELYASFTFTEKKKRRLAPLPTKIVDARAALQMASSWSRCTRWTVNV